MLHCMSFAIFDFIYTAYHHFVHMHTLIFVLAHAEMCAIVVQ